MIAPVFCLTFTGIVRHLDGIPRPTLTAKGQTTVPKEVRKELGLKVDEELRWFPLDDGKVMVATTLSPSRLYGVLPKPPRPVSIEEMNPAYIPGAAPPSGRAARSRRRKR